MWSGSARLDDDSLTAETNQDTVATSFYMPSGKINIRNQKDNLFNHFVRALRNRNIFWPLDLSASADKFVSIMTEVLWYIDGHHEQLSERSTPVPNFFIQFQGYNRPELSKHRKRTLTNLSQCCIELHVNNIASCLQCSYWDTSHVWMNFKVEVSCLLDSLYNYSEYLCKKQKVSVANHRSQTSIRSLPDNIQLIYLPPNSNFPSKLESLVEAVRNEEEYNYICVNLYTPDEPVKKFRYIECLKFGIDTPCMLLVYSPGSNVGNQYYLWKVCDEDDIFTRSQQVIEKVKLTIPVYHTRAMRKAMYTKYGRICPSVKPATLRFMYHDLTGINTKINTIDQQH